LRCNDRTHAARFDHASAAEEEKTMKKESIIDDLTVSSPLPPLSSFSQTLLHPLSLHLETAHAGNTKKKKKKKKKKK
jgi:hypothetical protein